jgi:hypothetical protein
MCAASPAQRKLVAKVGLQRFQLLHGFLAHGRCDSEYVTALAIIVQSS